MFHIKICGITNVEDAVAAAQAGADAIGLNFYAHSSRCVTPEIAGEIVAALPKEIVKVGVFVNAPVEEVCRLFDDLPLDLIQLHGDEPPEYPPQLGGRPTMRVFRVPRNDRSMILSMAAYLNRCRELDASPRMILLDARVEGVFGGSGKTTDWAIARELASRHDFPSLVLAGGLTPQNVAEAIRTVRPAAVDVAGGVELDPRRKDAVAIAAFVQAARDGFAAPVGSGIRRLT